MKHFYKTLVALILMAGLMAVALWGCKPVQCLDTDEAMPHYTAPSLK